MENQRRKEQKNNIVSFVPNGDYYFKKALRAIDHDQMDKAYKYMKRAAELSPNEAHILMQFGIMEMDAGNFDSAYECIHTAYSLEPSEAEYVFFLSEVSGCLGLVHDAKKYAEMYLDMDPEGLYCFEAKEILDYIEFEDDIEPFDEEDGEKMVAQEKARRFMENGRFPDAIEVLEELIETYPDLWPAYNNLALAYFYTGEIEDAKALLYHVLRENHGNLHAICNLAVIAYYEKSEKELAELIEILKKVNPFDFENRYKLGATLSLIGEHELAFKWLRSMSKRGYVGDSGFYFWLAQSAYFCGHVEIAENAWKALVEMDPSKKGLEPWQHIKEDVNSNALEQNRDVIIEKITSKYSAHRMFGFFLLSKSAYKQEIVAHPTWVDLSKYNGLEKLSLAYALNHQFNKNNKIEKHFERAMEVAEKLYEISGSVTVEVQYLFQMWFVLCERALQDSYEFKNVKALAAAVDYMFNSTINSNRITKKEYAEKYSISVGTLTKYVEDLIKYLPFESK
ncbi:tetratricopeptide repeat protein [Ureibacillus manganicus]|uniref:Transcriptional regulator n=1 Tax=Ureibacillus manganicus DSM 26584 TaxID=1384049 RepID=A0A0A3I5D9_9BACL|nr:tetratricopeptide repeat protein [Ureibacillus manganicus]KGR80016.1 transcriptional regulator [Ureibacillus manganicus DSM 26584]